MKLFSIKDVANLIGIDETRIHYAHRSGKVAEATHFVANRRIYTGNDLQRVAEHFGVELDQNLEMKEMKT